VAADVSRGNRAEEGIAERVKQDIAVGMRDQPMGVGNAHTSEHHRISGPESVNVETLPDPHAPFSCASPR
jgi:hypothetical protein